MNTELHTLYEQDQADRQAFEQLNRKQRKQILKRDRERRQRVEALLRNEVLQSPEDYFHVAMIFQHGEKLEHFWQAYELALKGAELGHTDCRWLSAAAYDRWLMHQGKLQKYGTQYTARNNQPYRLWDVDPTTTDEERAAWNVPPLREALKQADELNRGRELSKSGVLRPQEPKRLASLEIAGLRVEVIALDEQFVHVAPQQELQEREELPTPDNYPSGWKLYRLSEGYIATAADGEEVIIWYNVPQPELSYACREDEVPQLEAMQLGDHPAIVIKKTHTEFSELFLQIGAAHYLVGGQVPLSELLKLATSVP